MAQRGYSITDEGQTSLTSSSYPELCEQEQPFSASRVNEHLTRYSHCSASFRFPAVNSSYLFPANLLDIEALSIVSSPHAFHR